MAHVAFRQADIERIIRAARRAGAVVQIDLRSLVVTIYPGDEASKEKPAVFAPDGPEHWEDD